MLNWFNRIFRPMKTWKVTIQPCGLVTYLSARSKAHARERVFEQVSSGQLGCEGLSDTDWNDPSSVIVERY